MKFVRQFIKNPREMGAVAASGPALAKCIVDSANVQDAKIIAELGPGTGPFTREIMMQKRETAQVIGIEANAAFIRDLEKTFPDIHLFNRYAEDLPSILAEHGYDTCDSIVSGLPWAAFGYDMQERTLGAVHESLKENGTFATFTYIHSPYLPAGAKFAQLLSNTFSSVNHSRTIWKNLPPAFVYICKK